MINETHRFSSSSKRNSAGTGWIKKHSLLYNLLSFPLTPKSVQPSSMTDMSLTTSRIHLLPWDIYTHFTVRYHTQNNSVNVTILIFFSLSLQFSMETMNLKISQSARSKNIKMIRMLMKCTLKKGWVSSHIKNSDHLCVWPRSAFTTTGVSIEFKTIVVSNRDIRCITKAYINQNFPTDMYMFDNLTFKIKTSS